jgi:hypothetical protein
MRLTSYRFYVLCESRKGSSGEIVRRYGQLLRRARLKGPQREKSKLDQISDEPTTPFSPNLRTNADLLYFLIRNILRILEIVHVSKVEI